MADDDGGGGSSLPIVVAIAVVLALASGRTTTSESSTTSGSTTTSSSSSSTVVTSSSGPAPAPLASCPGRVVSQKTADDITMKIYYDAQAKGLNCVSVVHNGPVSSTGYLKTELHFANSIGIEWPEFASQTGGAGVAEVSGVYLVGTNDRCVTASATYHSEGSGGSTKTVSLSKVACG